MANNNNDDNNDKDSRYTVDIRVFLAVIVASMSISFAIGVGMGPLAATTTTTTTTGTTAMMGGVLLPKVTSVDLSTPHSKPAAGGITQGDLHEPAGQVRSRLFCSAQPDFCTSAFSHTMWLFRLLYDSTYWWISRASKRTFWTARHVSAQPW